MARLYSNENAPLPVVQRLRALGHDVLTSQEAGNANRGVPDSEVLAFAYEQDRMLLSNNRRDFLRMHRRGDPHCGMVLYTEDTQFDALADRIAAALATAVSTTRVLIRVTRLGHTIELQ